MDDENVGGEIATRGDVLPADFDPASLYALIRELALRYHPLEDLAVFFHMPLETLKQIAATPGVAARVLALSKEMDRTGERFELTSRKIAGEAMQLALEIARGENVSDLPVTASDRLRAAELLVKWSGLGKNEAPAVQVNIQTNLDAK